MTDRTDNNSMTVDRTSLEALGALAAVFVVFSAATGLSGSLGAVLVGSCWFAFGPVAAVAVGHLTLVLVGPLPLAVLVVLAAPLWALLFTSVGLVAAPRHLLAAGGAVLTTTTVLAVSTWLWSGSVAWPALVALLTIAGALYVVHRYAQVTLSEVPD